MGPSRAKTNRKTRCAEIVLVIVASWEARHVDVKFEFYSINGPWRRVAYKEVASTNRENNGKRIRNFISFGYRVRNRSDGS